MTQVTKDLIYCLKHMGMSQEDTVAVTLMLNTESKQTQLLRWIAKNRKADVQEILNQVSLITKEAK